MRTVMLDSSMKEGVNKYNSLSFFSRLLEQTRDKNVAALTHKSAHFNAIKDFFFKINKSENIYYADDAPPPMF